MMARRVATAITGITLLMLALVPVHAQQPEQPPRYRPLFTDRMIRDASTPEQGDRMREAEAKNRGLFDSRQKARLEKKEAAEREARAAEEARVNARRPAKPVRSKGKVFKWVDANGRVHFGDAPQSKNAQEVKVGGVARIQGTPPPPPGRTQDKDGAQDD